MIEGNTIKFGYGDVIVRNRILHIDIQQVKSPGECGEHPYDGEYEVCGTRVDIELNHEEYKEYLFLLDAVENRMISSFSFKGWVFDFTNYNAESMRVCRDAVIQLGFDLQSMAC